MITHLLTSSLGFIKLVRIADILDILYLGCRFITLWSCGVKNFLNICVPENSNNNQVSFHFFDENKGGNNGYEKLLTMKV